MRGTLFIAISLLILGLSLRAEEDHEDEKIILARILVMRAPSNAESRARNIANFESAKTESKNKEVQLTADYCICSLIWTRGENECVYWPFKRYKATAERTLATYPEHKNDMMIMWIEANLHDPQFNGDPNTETQWLYNRLAKLNDTEPPKFDPTGTLTRESLALQLLDLLTRTQARQDKIEPTAVGGAFNAVLNKMKSTDARNWLEFATKSQDRILEGARQRMLLDAAHPALKLDENLLKKAGGNKNSLSAKDWDAERREIVYPAGVNFEALPYLLWLLHDGIKLTNFENSPIPIAEFESNIYVDLVNVLRLQSSDEKGFKHLAETIASCGDYDELIWRAEDEARRAHEKSAIK
jgi:hypothetical protein